MNKNILCIKKHILTAMLIFAMVFCGCGKDDKKDSAETASAQSIPVENSIQVEHNEIVENEEAVASTDSNDTLSFEIESEETDEKEADEKSDDENVSEPDESKEDTDEKPEEQDAEKPETPDTSETQGQVVAGTTANIAFNNSWKYADFSAINSGSAVMYYAAGNRRNIVIGVNAGHGTKGGTSVKTYSHPDMTPKVTGGTNPDGAVKSTAVSSGMSFKDGASEASVTLSEARILRDRLLAAGYDVLMIRDGDDVQLDNVARTVMCNNNANCHIAIHWDGDGLDYDKGCFYISTPDGIKGMEPVASTWQKSEALGRSLIDGLSSQGCKINGKGSMNIDLTQTSYSTVPSVDIELGNAASVHDDATLSKLADGLVQGINSYFR